MASLNYILFCGKRTAGYTQELVDHIIKLWVKSSNLPNEALSTMETEEQLANALQFETEEIDAHREIVNTADSYSEEEIITASDTITRICDSENETSCSICETVYQGSVNCIICQKIFSQCPTMFCDKY